MPEFNSNILATIYKKIRTSVDALISDTTESPDTTYSSEKTIEYVESKFGGSENHSEFENDGTLHNIGDATTWDDFSVPLTRDKQGQSTKPDYDFTNLGLLFPQNDDSEIVYLVVQMPHRKKMNSDVKLHIHYIQAGAVKPTFKIDYKFYNNGEIVPGDWTTISTADGNKGIFTYGSGSMLQIATFPAVSLTDELISANLDMKLYRDDNDVSGDIITKYIDFHFEIDMQGSRSEFSK